MWGATSTPYDPLLIKGRGLRRTVGSLRRGHRGTLVPLKLGSPKIHTGALTRAKKTNRRRSN